MSRLSDALTTILLQAEEGVVTGVAAGQVGTAKVKLPAGETHGGVYLYCTIAGNPATRANLEQMLTTISVRLSTDEMLTLDVFDLIAMDEFHRPGVVGNTGVLYIPFSQLWMNGPVAMLSPNYGTDGEKSFEVYIGQAVGSTIDDIAVWTAKEPNAEPLGVHHFWRKQDVAAPATGLWTFNELPINDGEQLHAIHLRVPTVANITRCKLKLEQNILWDVTPTILAAFYRSCNPVKTPQANFIHLCFDARGFPSDAIPFGLATSSSLQLQIANAAPVSIGVITEWSSGSRKHN